MRGAGFASGGSVPEHAIGEAGDAAEQGVAAASPGGVRGVFRCSGGEIVGQEGLPSLRNGFRGEGLNGAGAFPYEALALLRVVRQRGQRVQRFIRRAGHEVIGSRVSIRGIGGIRAAHERNFRQPCVVKFCGRFVQLPTAAKITDGDGGIHVVIIVPAGGAANFQDGAGFVLEFFLPVRIPQFGREIFFIAEECDALEGVLAAGVARDDAGLRPVRHEDGTREPSCVEGVLNDVDVRRRVRQCVGDDIGDEESARRAKILRQRSGEADEDAIGRNVVDEAGVESGAPQEDPGLENPGLGAGDFAFFFEAGGSAFAPCDLLFLTGQEGPGQIKGNTHELFAR